MTGGGALRIVEPSFNFFKRSVSFPVVCGWAAFEIYVSVLVVVALIASQVLYEEMSSVGVCSGARNSCRLSLSTGGHPKPRRLPNLQRTPIVLRP